MMNCKNGALNVSPFRVGTRIGQIRLRRMIGDADWMIYSLKTVLPGDKIKMKSF
ncbi:MAG: hypothetical protein ACJ749_01170 [Flavisolibacter sp.]